MLTDCQVAMTIARCVLRVYTFTIYSGDVKWRLHLLPAFNQTLSKRTIRLYVL